MCLHNRWAPLKSSTQQPEWTPFYHQYLHLLQRLYVMMQLAGMTLCWQGRCLPLSIAVYSVIHTIWLAWLADGQSRASVDARCGFAGTDEEVPVVPWKELVFAMGAETCD